MAKYSCRIRLVPGNLPSTDIEVEHINKSRAAEEAVLIFVDELADSLERQILNPKVRNKVIYADCILVKK